MDRSGKCMFGSVATAKQTAVVQCIAAPRAGIFAEGAEPKRRCGGPTASFGNKALGEKAKRGVVRHCTTGC